MIVWEHLYSPECFANGRMSLVACNEKREAGIDSQETAVGSDTPLELFAMTSHEKLTSWGDCYLH